MQFEVAKNRVGTWSPGSYSRAVGNMGNDVHFLEDFHEAAHGRRIVRALLYVHDWSSVGSVQKFLQCFSVHKALSSFQPVR